MMLFGLEPEGFATRNIDSESERKTMMSRDSQVLRSPTTRLGAAWAPVSKEKGDITKLLLTS